MKSHAVPLYLAWASTHPFVQHLNAKDSPHPLITQYPSQLADRLSWYSSACVEVALILLNNGPNAQE